MTEWVAESAEVLEADVETDSETDFDAETKIEPLRLVDIEWLLLNEAERETLTLVETDDEPDTVNDT